MRFALIGCGERGTAQARYFAASKRAELALVVDELAEAVGRIGAAHGVKTAPSIDAALEDRSIDAVSIAAPHNLHGPLAIQALRAGKHVLCEKPIAHTLRDADAMIATAKQAGLKLGIWFPRRYAPVAVKARELVQAGYLGEITMTRLSHVIWREPHYWSTGVAGKSVPTDWRRFQDKAGGGVLLMNAVHSIDVMRWITGLEVARVYAEVANNRDPNEVQVEDVVGASLRYANGAVGVIETTNSAPGGWDVVPPRIQGIEGQLIFDQSIRLFTQKSAPFLTPGQWNSIEVPSAGERGVDLLDDFVAAVREGREPPITGEDGRKALEIVVAAYRSGEEHRPITLPIA